MLIVEDEEQVLKQMRIAVEDFIGDVFTAKNGEEAIDVLKQNKINILLVLYGELLGKLRANLYQWNGL